MRADRPLGIRMHGADAGQLYRETAALPRHTVKVLRLEHGAQVDVKDLVAHVQRRVDAQPFLRRVARRPGLPLAHLWWEELDTVDAREHVSLVRLDPSCPDEAAELAELDAAVGVVLSRRLSRDRPLWRLVLVQGRTVSAVVVATHHGLAAGALNDWFLSVLLGPEPSSGRSSARPLATTPAEFHRLLTLAPRLAVRSARAARSRKASHSSGSAVAPFSGRACSWNTRLSDRRSFASANVPLAEVKAVATTSGSTVTEVILAAVGGALREHLGDEVHPLDRDVTAVVPMSLRTPGPPEQQSANLTSTYFVNLRIHEPDPRRRLASVRSESRSGRAAIARTDQSMGYDVLELGPLREGFYRGALAFGRHVLHRPAASLIVSSVKGETGELVVCGCPVVDVASGGVLFDDCGLNVTTWTYGDTVTFGLVCDPAHLPGSAHLVRSMAAHVRRLGDTSE